jgi:hypothetical protein
LIDFIWLIDLLIDGWMDGLNTCLWCTYLCRYTHGAWPTFWSVLKKCHMLGWHWSVLPLAHHSYFPFFYFANFGACWFLYVSTILWLTHRDCRIFRCVHTLDLGLWSYPKCLHEPRRRYNIPKCISYEDLLVIRT